MFLRSARNAQFNVPKQYFDEGLDFAERCYETNPANHEKGVFRYRPPGSQDQSQITLANTAWATLTLILGGRQDHVGVGTAVRWFRRTTLSSSLGEQLLLLDQLLQQSSDGASRRGCLEEIFPKSRQD